MPKLLEQVRTVIRLRHYSLRTELKNQLSCGSVVAPSFIKGQATVRFPGLWVGNAREPRRRRDWLLRVSVDA